MSGEIGGDELRFFETRPLEDILADLASGWNDTQHCAGRLKAGTYQEVGYVL